MLTVTAIGLLKKENAGEQMSFFDTAKDANEKEEKLEKVIDNIRQKFGNNVIVAGSIMDRTLGMYRKKEDSINEVPENKDK